MKKSNFKLERIKAGLTQRDLAKQLGISQSLISGYELEQLQPSPERAQAIATLLGTKTETLFNERSTL